MRTPQAPEIPGLTFVSPLGQGGYSEVHLYDQHHPRMRVAVKVLRTDGMLEELRSQFVDEANAMAELADHPFIVPVLGAGTASDGRPYLVMRYYPPPDLGARVKEATLSLADALRTGIQIASAVETAHVAGILHRDIKPANILISPYGVPGLTDFGIAGRDTETARETDLGVSVPWAAPEILAGSSNGSVASDVYSLAATLHNLLTGRPPFHEPDGDNSQRALMARTFTVPVPPTKRPDVPHGLELLLQRAMAKNPADRPASARAFALELQEIEKGQGLNPTDFVVLDGAAPVAPARALVDDATRRKTPVRPGPPAQSDGGPTIQRPRAVDPGLAPQAATDASSPAAPGETRQPRLPRRLLVAAGAGLAATAGVGAAILIGSGSPNAAPDDGTGTTAPPPSPIRSTLRAPEVTATARGDQVRFRWTYPGTTPEGSSWVVFLQDSGTTRFTEQTYFDTPRLPDRPTCAQVWILTVDRDEGPRPPRPVCLEPR